MITENVSSVKPKIANKSQNPPVMGYMYGMASHTKFMLQKEEI